MAFAQRQRRPHQRPHLSVSESAEDISVYGTAQDISQTDHVLLPGWSRSDSDNDWHVISSTLHSSSSQASSAVRRDSLSPGLYASEPESYSSFRLSDGESTSDADTQTSAQRQTAIEFSVLPSHDGTGTFIADDGLTSDATHQDDSDPEAFARVMHRMLDERRVTTWRTHASEFEPETASMPNILLPHGGIKPPSFVTRPENDTIRAPHHTSARDDQSSLHSSEFRPTMADFYSQKMVQSSEVTPDQDQAQSSEAQTDSGNDVKFARRRRRNLDRIPGHHPAIPGTLASAAILAAIWDNIRRLTTNFLENDANTSETFSALVSEAAYDGCMPFGSHLHMDFGSGLLPTYASRSRAGNLQDI